MRFFRATITPSKAKEMLSKNKNNRHVSSLTVDRYAKDMRDGLWRLTHQGILLGKDDCIIDGQHRLLAIIKSGTSQDMFVYKEELLETALDLPIDIGYKRSSSFITGKSKSVVAVAALAAKIAYSEKHASSLRMKFFIEKVEEPLFILQKGKEKSSTLVTSAPVKLACVAHILLKNQREYIVEQYEAISSADFNKFSKAISRFYKQIAVDKPKIDNKYLFSRAFRAFDEGRKDLTKLFIKSESAAYDEARDALIKALSMGEKINIL